MQQDVTFQSDGNTLAGTLHLPDDLRSGERRPAVIMLHGFGANRNGGPAWFCGQLEVWGYVGLRIDFRGCGESGGERGRVIPMQEVADARKALSYLAGRPEVDPQRIALAGSSLGAGVAIHAAAVDPRVAAIILENAVANGERTIRGMHSAESWEQFLDRMEAGLQARARGDADAKIHRFEIFEMPKHLQVNLRSNNSLMEFSADTPAAFFMFRPEDMIAKVAPRPILILHSAGDKVCTAEEAFNLARLAKPPVELHLMDGANHFLFVDPDPRIAVMLRTWLDQFFPVSGARPAS